MNVVTRLANLTIRCRQIERGIILCPKFVLVFTNVWYVNFGLVDIVRHYYQRGGIFTSSSSTEFNQQVESFSLMFSTFHSSFTGCRDHTAADVVYAEASARTVFLATNAYILDVSCISSHCGGNYMNFIPGPKLFAEYHEHFCATQHWSSSWII